MLIAKMASKTYSTVQDVGKKMHIDSIWKTPTLKIVNFIKCLTIYTEYIWCAYLQRSFCTWISVITIFSRNYSFLTSQNVLLYWTVNQILFLFFKKIVMVKKATCTDLSLILRYFFCKWYWIIVTEYAYENKFITVCNIADISESNQNIGHCKM